MEEEDKLDKQHNREQSKKELVFIIALFDESKYNFSRGGCSPPRMDVANHTCSYFVQCDICTYGS